MTIETLKEAIQAGVGSSIYEKVDVAKRFDTSANVAEYILGLVMFDPFFVPEDPDNPPAEEQDAPDELYPEGA